LTEHVGLWFTISGEISGYLWFEKGANESSCCQVTNEQIQQEKTEALFIHNLNQTTLFETTQALYFERRVGEISHTHPKYMTENWDPGLGPKKSPTTWTKHPLSRTQKPKNLRRVKSERTSPPGGSI
jgi:hypothetical protein